MRESDSFRAMAAVVAAVARDLLGADRLGSAFQALDEARPLRAADAPGRVRLSLGLAWPQRLLAERLIDLPPPTR